MEKAKVDIVDSNLRNLLKHELDSLWRPDEGPQAQMSSVIEALQELKLLQVKTALEELEFAKHSSSRTAPLALSSEKTQLNSPQNPKQTCTINMDLIMEPSLFLTSSPDESRQISRRREICRPHRGSLSTSSSFSSQDDSTNSSFSSCDIEDPSDWTTSLNQSRNRQPLVLGNNVFADLVGNWLDLPDVGGITSDKMQNDSSLKDTILASSRGNPQDLSKNLSLTTNIFKRVLRRFGGREKQESEGLDVCKQPNVACRKSKSNVSKPFWRRAKGMKKKTQWEGVANQESGLIDTWVEIYSPMFHYDSAVWV